MGENAMLNGSGWQGEEKLLNLRGKEFLESVKGSEKDKRPKDTPSS